MFFDSFALFDLFVSLLSFETKVVYSDTDSTMRHIQQANDKPVNGASLKSFIKD